MTAAQDQRETRTTTQPVQRKEGGGTEGSAGGAIKSGLRGASFAEGEAMLTPGGSPPAAPVQRKAGGGASSAPGAVVQRDETVGERVPGNVDLRSARIGFTLPANRTLSSDWTHEATTGYGVGVTIEASPQELRIYTSPALEFDVQFPGANMRFYSAGVRFASGEVFANFHKSGTGFDVTDKGRETVVSLISSAIAGSAMARPGYNPMNDANLTSTRARIKANFDSLPAAGGGADVAASDVSRPTIGATLAMRTPFFQESDGAGVRIAAGGQFDVTVSGSGNLSRILAAGDAQSAAMAAGIQSVSVRSDAIELIKDGEAIAKLKSLSVAPGGRVTLQQFEMLGGLGAGAGMESLFRAIIGGIALAERGVPLDVGIEATARSGGAEPELVRGVSRAMIENGLSAAVQSLLNENRHAVPGIDLGLVFGAR